MNPLASDDPIVFLRSCLERALWEAERGGRPVAILVSDLSSFEGDRSVLAARAAPFLELFGDPTRAGGVDFGERLCELAAEDGIGHLRSWDEAFSR